MSDLALRLAPRSAVATADVELLRLARTEITAPAPAVAPSLVGRIRDRASIRFGREGSRRA